MFESSTRILVVDDMSSLRALTIGFLVEFGFFDILEAGDGNEAWEQLEKSDPPIQLVISDLNMPNATGLDLLKKMRGDKRFTNTPFIMVTTESESGLVMLAVQLRVTNYCVKPITAAMLKDKMIQSYKRVKGIK